MAQPEQLKPGEATREMERPPEAAEKPEERIETGEDLRELGGQRVKEVEETSRAAIAGGTKQIEQAVASIGAGPAEAERGKAAVAETQEEMAALSSETQGEIGAEIILSPEEARKKMQEDLEDCFSSNGNGLVNISRVEVIISAAEKKNIPLDLSKPEFAAAFQKRLEVDSSGSGAADVLDFAEKRGISLDLSRPEVAANLQRGLENSLFGNSIPNAEKTISAAEKKGIPIDLSKPEIASACSRALIDSSPYAGNDRIFAVLNFADKRNISIDFSNPEVVSAWLEALRHRTGEGKMREVEDLLGEAKKRGVPLPVAVAHSFRRGVEQWREKLR